MAHSNTNDRSPRDLSVPETMRIAALLAELMPPGVEGSDGSAPILLPSNDSDSIHDGQGTIVESPALQMQDLDEADEAEAEDMTVTKPIPSFAEVNGSKPTPVASLEAKPAPVTPPEPAPVSAKLAEPLPAVAKSPEPAHPALDPDLIPLGSLTVAGYFSLVNWKNDPRRVRHPSRADYGLDAQSLAQASRNPFYVVGQARRPEDRSVSEVMAEIAWE